MLCKTYTVFPQIVSTLQYFPPLNTFWLKTVADAGMADAYVANAGLADISMIYHGLACHKD